MSLQMDLIFFHELVSIVVWNSLNEAKASNVCFRKWVHTILVLLFVKVIKSQVHPIVIFIGPHKSMCTNSKRVLSIFFGSPFWKESLHCLSLIEPMQKSSCWSILISMQMNRFFCTRNFKFCSPRWLNFSCQTFKFSFF